MFATHSLKGMAKVLRQILRDRGVEIAHGECLDIVARLLGTKDWNRLAALFEQDATDKPLILSIVGETIALHRTTQRLDVNDTDLSGSRFNDANLSVTSFNQINFSGATFNDSNMTGWHVNDVNLAGSVFQHINLSGVRFSNCRVAGTLFDGVPLEEMIAAHAQSASSGR